MNDIDDGADLQDELDDFDPQVCTTSERQPQACRPADAPNGFNIPPLAHTDDLVVCDEHGKEDFAAWVQKCPIAACSAAAASTPCIIQRSDVHTVDVLAESSTLRLRVRRLVCRSHRRNGRSSGVSFLLSHPAVFQQLQRLKLRIVPQIYVLNAQTIVAESAYS